MKKKFISIIWWYHAQILSFDAKQNYHMLPLEVMKEAGYECEIFSIDASVRIGDDPNLIPWVNIIYYSNIVSYLNYLWKNRDALIYSNTLTLKTLLVGLIAKHSVFMPHDQAVPLKEKKLKRIITLFFYRFFTSIRVVNTAEQDLLKTFSIRSEILPIAISEKFYHEIGTWRNGFVFVGNLYYDKNPEFLLETMKILEKKGINEVLHIFWEDRYDKDWKNFSTLVNESWLDHVVKIHGFVPHKQLAEELAKRIIYINTSLSEGQCLTAYEAALAGCFSCLQDILAFPSVFKENALYHQTPSELAENICSVLENLDSAEKKIQMNQTMIQNQYNFEYLKTATKKYFLSLTD